MQHTRAWLNQRRKLQSRIVSMFSGALLSQFNRYFAYRLRYFTGLIFITSLTTALEFFFLFYYVDHQESLHIVFYRLLLVLLTGLWWGFTEVMRTRIRWRQREVAYEAIKDEIRNWFSMTCILSVMFVIGAGFLMYQALHLPAHATVINKVYGAVILFQCAAVLLYQVLHSALYALLRISRPFISIFMGHLLAMLTLFITYGFLQEYALALSYFIGGVMTLGISAYYVLRMNRVVRLIPRDILRFRGMLTFIKQLPVSESLLTSVSAGLIAAQPAAFLLLLKSPHNEASYVLVMMYYLISTQFQYAHDWAEFFYPDFKRLLEPVYQNVKRIYMRQMNGVAMIVGCGLFVLSAGLLLLFFGLAAFALIAALLVIYLLRAFYAIRSVDAFCSFRYGVIIVSAGFLLAAITGVYFLEINYTEKLVLIILAMIIENGIIFYWRGKVSPYARRREYNYSIGSWAKAVSAYTKPCQIVQLQFELTMPSAKYRLINSQLKQLGMVLQIHNKTLWLLLAHDEKEQAVDWRLTQVCGGYLTKIDKSPLCANGQQSLRDLLKQPCFTELAVSDEASLISAFHRLFFHGGVIDIREKQTQVIDFSQRDMADVKIFSKARSFLYNPLANAYTKEVFVTALMDQGGLSTIFWAPVDEVDLGSRKRWCYLLIQYHFLRELV